MNLKRRAWWIGALSIFDISGRWTLHQTDAVLDDITAESMDRARARMRQILAEMPQQSDDPGAMDDLAAEIESWSLLRREATTALLGDD